MSPSRSELIAMEEPVKQAVPKPTKSKISQKEWRGETIGRSLLVWAQILRVYEPLLSLAAEIF